MTRNCYLLPKEISLIIKISIQPLSVFMLNLIIRNNYSIALNKLIYLLADHPNNGHPNI